MHTFILYDVMYVANPTFCDLHKSPIVLNIVSLAYGCIFELMLVSIVVITNPTLVAEDGSQ